VYIDSDILVVTIYMDLVHARRFVVRGLGRRRRRCVENLWRRGRWWRSINVLRRRWWWGDLLRGRRRWRDGLLCGNIHRDFNLYFLNNSLRLSVDLDAKALLSDLLNLLNCSRSLRINLYTKALLADFLNLLRH
jgi:hypothetical protein